MRRGWGRGRHPAVPRISALTIGLLGYGRIARHLGNAVKAMGATVITHDPYVTETTDGTKVVTYEELLARSDVLSLHCPLTRRPAESSMRTRCD